MALTKANALSEVRRQINEPTANFISDTEINEWLDRGARNISAIVGCAQVTETESLADSTYIYPLASHDWIEITGVYIEDGDTVVRYGLQRIHLNQIGHVQKQVADTSDLPLFYCPWGTGNGSFNVLVWVPAGSSMTAYDIVVFGYEIVDGYSLNSTSDPYLPDSLNQLAVDYAIAMAHIKMGNHSKAGVVIKKYMNDLMIARNDQGYAYHERLDTKDMMHLPDVRVPIDQQ